jgi:glycosyltransferase involved in cell wall biosynthesis
MAGVIECFERLTANEPFDTLRLKIPGRRDNFRTIIQEQINRSSCRDRVDLLGPVDEVSLVDLYRRARLLLFPSRYEGFGFPVLEAMAFGTPVVTSNCSSLPEVAGDAAVLVDPEDIPQMARACAALLGDPVRMQSLVERGRRRVLDYRWEECARQVHAVLLRAGRPFLGA